MTRINCAVMSIVPKVTDEMFIPLQRLMLERAPTFKFSQEDVEALASESGLNKAQVEVWADHVQFRATIQSVEDVLNSLRRSMNRAIDASIIRDVEEDMRRVEDYENEIKNLKEALAHKTKLCDRIEGQKGRLTMEINKLKWELGEKSEENETLRKDKQAQGKKIQELQEQLDLCQSIALLKQMQEEAQRTAEILSSTLAEERTTKRPRA